MKKTLLFFTTLICLLIGCKKEDTKDATGSCYLNNNAQTIIHNGLNREYVVYIPDSYDGSIAVPLLLNFHGFGGNASSYISEADMRPIAETATFILVYPQGSCLNGASHWNACPLGGDNKSTTDDFGFVEALINELSAQYNVDRNRVYAAGYSNGGMMAYGLANHKSNLIAAVASVAGAMLDCTGFTTHPMPVVHLHGTADSVIPYEGNSDWNAAANTINHWVNFNHTTTTPTLSTDESSGTTIEHYTYDQGENAVAVEHYKYIGGEHVWFSATYQGQTTAELVWNFLSRYDLNGLR